MTKALFTLMKMERFEQLYPDRYFDVAIAEQHSVTFAAGLACEGLKPVVAIYSTFLQRAYDQVVHDVVLQELPVMFAIDRAGVGGGDGPTHAGACDVTCLRFVKPLDEEIVVSLARDHDLLVTVEESAAGGAGSAVSECLAAHGMTSRLLHLGLPDRFIEHGGRGDMLADAGLDAAGIARSVDESLSRFDADSTRARMDGR